MENTIKKKKRFKKWNLNDYELLIMAFTGLAFLIVFFVLFHRRRRYKENHTILYIQPNPFLL